MELKCKKCGSNVILERIMTNPPSMDYTCPNCGLLSESDIVFNIQQT